MGAGSVNPPRLIELRYKGAGTQTPIALTGKGIAFDSGGLSIKDAKGMETMKCDMGGAASILATMKAIAHLKPKINVIAAIPSSENMPSGSATKPGDVLTHRGGTTSEVLNTDAEGRLVLADALAYLAEKKPRVIIDTATLTGACMVALGDQITGAMGNDDALFRDIAAAGDAVGETMWPLPLYADYRRLIDSTVADVKNIGERWGGAITAALVPGGVRRRHAVGAPGHRRPGVGGEGERSRSEGRDRRAGAHPRPLRPGSEQLTAVPEEADAPTARTGPVLGIFAHPDDAEISAGGTMAKWVAAGRDVHLLVLTNGDRGSNDRSRDRAELAATRLRETEAAAEVLGLASVRSLGIPDGELANTQDVREAAIRRIREVRAETVLSVDPTAWFFENRYYNHSDHRTAGEIALDAVFPGAGNPHYFSEHLEQGLDVSEVHDIWLGLDERVQPHRGRLGRLRDEDRRAREAREPADGRDRVLRGVPGEGSRRARREDRRQPRRGLPRARPELILRRERRARGLREENPAPPQSCLN